MIVISQGNRPQVDVIRDTIGPVNNERSPRASSILTRIVRMIPGSSISVIKLNELESLRHT